MLPVEGWVTLAMFIVVQVAGVAWSYGSLRGMLHARRESELQFREDVQRRFNELQDVLNSKYQDLKETGEKRNEERVEEWRTVRQHIHALRTAIMQMQYGRRRAPAGDDNDGADDGAGV